MKLHVRLAALLTAFLLVLSVCGCARDASSLDRILRQERIVFGIAPDNLPVSGGTAQDPTGIAADIGEEIAARLGAEAEYILLPAQEAIAALDEGRIDCYICLPEPDIRTATQLSAVDTLFGWRQVAVVPRWSEAKRLVDLAGERLCVLSDSDAADALDAAELFKASMSGIVYADDFYGIMHELTGSTCAAAIVDEMQFILAAKETGEGMDKFVVIDEPLESRSYILAMRYSDAPLRERIQSIYDDMNTGGVVAAIRAEWLG